MSRQKATGSFTVGRDQRGWPSLTAAISVAQNRACRATEPWSVGVFANGEKLVRVERHEDGSVTTTALKEER